MEVRHERKVAAAAFVVSFISAQTFAEEVEAKLKLSDTLTVVKPEAVLRTLKDNETAVDEAKLKEFILLYNRTEFEKNKLDVENTDLRRELREIKKRQCI